MPKDLPLADFRRVRQYLTDDEFAYAEGPQYTPEVRIAPETWWGIVGLPTDVSIRTTDFKPNSLAKAYEKATSWIDAYPYSDGSPLHLQTLAVSEGLEAALFSAVSGWYRQAGTCLRVALDDLLLGFYYHGQPGRKQEFEDIIIRGAVTPRFACLREALFEVTANSIFAYPEGGYGKLYDDLSVYVHRIPDHSMWRSNGPIFKNESFDKWWREFQQCDSVMYEAYEAILSSLPWNESVVRKCRPRGARQGVMEAP